MLGKVETWDLDEVCIWLKCIGLGEKTEPFRENTVDGESLLSLAQEDLTSELGLSNLQAKKVLRNLKETSEILALQDKEAPGGGDDGSATTLELQQMKDKLEAKEASLAELKEKIAALEAENADLKAAAKAGDSDGRGQLGQSHPGHPQQGYYAYPPAPGQPVYPPPASQEDFRPVAEAPQKPRGPGVVGGAAAGAAGGALKGAVVGAILPGMSAGDGAAAGAAVGAMGGAGKGFLNRRRR